MRVWLAPLVCLCVAVHSFPPVAHHRYRTGALCAKQKPQTPPGKWVRAPVTVSDLDAAVGLKALPIGNNVYLLGKKTQTEAYFAIDPNCGRCKFPMINGKLTLTNEEEVLCCPLCGTTHSLTDGTERSPVPVGFVQDLASKLLRSATPNPVRVYDVRVSAQGVLVNVIPTPQ